MGFRARAEPGLCPQPTKGLSKVFQALTPITDPVCLRPRTQQAADPHITGFLPTSRVAPNRAVESGWSSVPRAYGEWGLSALPFA
jgi:hypothetical protein